MLRFFQRPPELKSMREIGLMREAGKIVARALAICRALAKPGVRTLEILETQSVPVVGYGTCEFPAFYLHSSGEPVSARVNTPEEAALLLQSHWIRGGLRRFPGGKLLRQHGLGISLVLLGSIQRLSVGVKLGIHSHQYLQIVVFITR